MKFKSLVVAVLLLGTFRASSQGTFVYDQQSTAGAIWEGFYVIQSSQPAGQSFTPSLNAVGVIQLFLIGVNPGNNANAVVYVNLLSGSITGPVIGQSSPVTVPIGVESSFDFLFLTSVTVSPGTTYYLQPVVQSGAADASVSVFYHYTGGTSIINGLADSSRNLYFREGIVVPEPSTWALLALGVGAFILRRRCGN